VNNGGTATDFGTTGQSGSGSSISLSFSGSVSVSAGTSVDIYLIPYGCASSGTTVRFKNGSTFTVTATSAGGSTPPTLTADITNNDVDHPIDITFSENLTWRNAVTSVKISGTALASGDYALTSGNLQLKPSNGNSLLTTAGSKSVAVVATGYNDATVTQQINAGADNKLGMKTQPAAPSVNGGSLATQPAVYIQDQYGNTTASTASVVAAVGAGTWTLGGTTSVAGVSGTATFSGLTATSASAVTGATISFSCGSLTGITSNSFNIPAPAPSISLSTNSLTGFTYAQGNGPSSEKPFTISGLNLTSDISITAATDYEISLTSGSGYTTPITLTQSGGTVSTTTIYVRLKAGLSMGTYNSENISITSGTLSDNVTCSGSVTCSYGSFPYVEDFNYTTSSLLTNNCWTAHSSGGTAPIAVSSNSISYPGYLSSGVGNEVTMAATGEDVNRTFTAQTSGTLFASFLVNVTSASLSGDYFFHLGQTVIGTTIYRGRVFVKRDASNNLAFGVAQSTTTVNYTAFSYALNTTYLVVLKFEIVNGTSNDISAIYINPALNAAVPLSGWIANTDASGADLTEVGSVALRQGGSSSGAALKIDGIRISTSWSDIVGPIPTFSGTGDWTETARWNTGVVPGTTSTVIIDGTATISTAVTVAECTINNSRSLTIAKNGSLSVTGTLTNSAGNSGLVIKSDADGTGSLIHSTANVPATVERYINNDQKWHFLSSPVSGQTIWTAFAPAPPFGSSGWDWDFYYLNPTESLNGQYYWVNLRKSDGSYNSGLVDAAGADAGFGTNTPPTMTPGRGYVAAYSGVNWAATTHSFTGTLNQGSVNQTLAFNKLNTFYLVGNPYPSSIDWKASTGWDRGGDTLNGGGYDYWIYNDNTGNYGVYNSSTGGSSAWLSQYIAPGQAFLVQTKLGGGNFNMNDNVRVHSSQPWLKEANTENSILRFKLTTNANDYSDEMLVAFDPASAPGGSEKLMSIVPEAPEMWSPMAGNSYSIARYTQPTGDLVVPVSVKAGTDAGYTLTAANITDFTLAGKVYLEDTKTGATQELRSNPAYAFNGAPGDAKERFRLHFGEISGTGASHIQTPLSIWVTGGTVHVANPAGLNGTVIISNILGQEILRKTVSGTSAEISVNGPSGYYIVSVVTNQQTTNRKILIR